MPKDTRDLTLEDELARIRASFLKAAAVASAAAAPTSVAATATDSLARAPAAQHHGGALRPQSASARPHPSAVEGSKNSELYQVYVGSLKQMRPRKSSARGHLPQHIAVRVPVAAGGGSADADDVRIDEDTGHDDGDGFDDSVEKLLTAKAAASSSRSRRITSAPLTRSSLEMSFKSASDAAHAAAVPRAPKEVLQSAEAGSRASDVPAARVLKSRPASASHAQRSSFDWSSRSKPAASQLQRAQADGAAAQSSRKVDASLANPYVPVEADAHAQRPRPNAESFLARVAAAAERTGGVNDALQLSMMRRRGEGRNVYVTDGSCPDLKGCMDARGWHLNPSASSPLFDLRWTLQEADSDILTLQPGQINNHFPQNHILTTKVGLLKSLRGLRWSADCDEETFFPRAYDLSDPAQKEDWIDDFKFCATASVIELVSRMHVCAIHCGNLSHHACVAGRGVVRMTLSEAYRHISTRSDANFLNPAPLSITELDDEAWASIHSLRRSLLTSHWAASEAGSFIRIDADSQESGRPIDVCRECRKMLGANASLNLCSVEAADHADLVSRCGQVYDSLKEFCPQRSLLGPAACWIVKPNCSSRGVGVRLTDDMVELAAGKSEGRVVQKYIERPMLVSGKKFDLRVWVLVTSWAPLAVWVFPGCLARFCSHPFSLCELGNKYRHLTNVSLNKSVAGAGGDVTWSAEDIKDAIDAQFREGFWEHEVWPKVVRTCALAFISAQGVIEQHDGCFELFGCDVALDSLGHPWLLEVNTSPDLRHSTPSKKAITPTLVEDTMKIVLDIGLSTVTQELARSYGARRPSPQLQEIGSKFLETPAHWNVGLWRLAYVGFIPPASTICSQATLLSINGSKISGKTALRMAAVAGAAEHAAAAIFSVCVVKRGIARGRYSERYGNAVFLQSILRRSFVSNIMADLRGGCRALQSCLRRLNARHSRARLFAYLKLASCMKALLGKKQVAFSYAQQSLVRFVRMKIERNWIVRWFQNESVVRRVFLGMVARHYIKKAKQLIDQGIPDSISTICRLVIGANVENKSSTNIVAIIESFKARDLAMKKARVLQASVRRALERSHYVDELCARSVVAACHRFHIRRGYVIRLVASHIAALMKQICIRLIYQKKLSMGRRLIDVSLRTLLRTQHSRTVSASVALSAACRRALCQAAFTRRKRAARCIASWGAAATVRARWSAVRATMVIARRLLTCITCWRWKSIYSVAVLRSRLSSWVFRKRFTALRKCARSLQVMCLWLLARRRACITLQHAFRCHSSRGKIAQLVEQRAKLISRFLRRRKMETVNPSFRVVSLHTAKEVSELYTHSKTAAELESERRPWRRLKRTALRDAEALAESVIGIPAEDLRRRFRGVIGRRVLVTLSSIASIDENALEPQSAGQSSHAASGLAPEVAATALTPPDAPAARNESSESQRPPPFAEAPRLTENCPPPGPMQTRPDAAAGSGDEKQSSVARYLHLKNHAGAASLVTEERVKLQPTEQQRPSTGHPSSAWRLPVPAHLQHDHASAPSALWVQDAEGANCVGASQPAVGRVLRDGRIGAVSKTVPGASVPQMLVAQQNLPRVIQLPKQILLHLEATAKTRASISAAISTEPLQQLGVSDLNTLRKIYSQSTPGPPHMRSFSASK